VGVGLKKFITLKHAASFEPSVRYDQRFTSRII
jgi:hypothetical protein